MTSGDPPSALAHIFQTPRLAQTEQKASTWKGFYNKSFRFASLRPVNKPRHPESTTCRYSDTTCRLFQTRGLRLRGVLDEQAAKEEEETRREMK